MKKAISLLLALAMCLSLCACGARTKMVISGFDGTPALNAALVSEHLDRVELTVDNWKDYITVYQYDVEVVKKDTFGEITSSEESTVFRLGCGTERYCGFGEVAIELQHKETGEITIYGSSNHLGKSFILDDAVDLDEYECTRIKGYIFFIDYPEEVFEEVLDRYDRTSISRGNNEIKVNWGSSQDTWYVDCEAKVIENGSGSWNRYFD